MDSRFNNKSVLTKLETNICATNPQEYSAGLIATFSVSAALVVVRIMSGLGVFGAKAFQGAGGELLVSLIWPILGGFLIPVFLYFLFSRKGKLKEKFSVPVIKQNFHNFGYRKLSLKFILLSIAFGILYSIANQGIATLTQAIMRVLGLRLGGGDAEYGGVGHLLVMIFTSAILPAICEETVDRGILTYSLKKRGDWFAIIMSAAIFGFTHMNIAQTFYTFALGLIVGYIVVKTGNIIPGIIAHFINNFGATLFSYLYVKDLPGGELYEMVDYLAVKMPIILFFMWAAALAAAIFLARFMVKHHSAEDKLARLREKNKSYEELVNSQTETGEVRTDTAERAQAVLDAQAAAQLSPYKTRFKEDVFLYGALILNAGATLFSLIWALI